MDIQTKQYNLKVYANQNWSLLAVANAIPWLEKLAKITKLSPKKSSPNHKSAHRIIVIKSRELSAAHPFAGLPKKIGINLPKTGWHNRDQKHCQIWTHSSSKTVIFEISKDNSFALNIIRMWTILDIIYQQVIDRGGFPIHSALVRKGQKGVIIAAHGGTGKSTCCQRIPPPWVGVCDDEVLIVRDQRGRYFAHPGPTWSNFLMKRKKRPTWAIEGSVPVAAFCFLKQSKKDRIEFIGQGQGAICINQHSLQIAQRSFRHLEKEEEIKIRHRLFENACQAAKTLPSYILEAHKNGQFWKEIDKILK
ncbi:MAG: SynChlorMet cassette protein ScmC [Candidatus Margulisiibacteriota bacterium]